jgi:hypothetical protein
MARAIRERLEIAVHRDFLSLPPLVDFTGTGNLLSSVTVVEVTETDVVFISLSFVFG